MMMNNELSKEISRGTIEIVPRIEIEVVNLDNGQRIITEKSMESFIKWFGDDEDRI